MLTKIQALAAMVVVADPATVAVLATRHLPRGAYDRHVAHSIPRRVLAAFLVLLVPSTAAAQLGAPPSQAQVEKAQRQLREGMAAADAGNWRVALEHFQESRLAASSVVAIDGIANAHYQMQHDEEALAAYDELLAQNPIFGPNDRALQQEWARMTSVARQRIAEINARRQRAAAAPPVYAPPKRELHGKYYDGEDVDDERSAHNVVFGEVAGNGMMYSINYERLFGDSNFSVRAGFSYMALGFGGKTTTGSTVSGSTSWVTIPLLGNYYVGGARNKLQLGLGVTILLVTGNASSGSLWGSGEAAIPCPTAVIGYRYLPQSSGFAFSVGFTPFIIPGSTRPVLPWGGLSFGGVF